MSQLMVEDEDRASTLLAITKECVVLLISSSTTLTICLLALDPLHYAQCAHSSNTFRPAYMLHTLLNHFRSAGNPWKVRTLYFPKGSECDLMSLNVQGQC